MTRFQVHDDDEVAMNLSMRSTFESNGVDVPDLQIQKERGEKTEKEQTPLLYPQWPR